MARSLGDSSASARDPATMAVAPGAMAMVVPVPSSHCTLTSGPFGVRTASRQPTRGGGMAYSEPSKCHW
jgi:hypothetical protein